MRLQVLVPLHVRRAFPVLLCEDSDALDANVE